MNEIAERSLMSGKELAEAFGVSKDTINSTVERLELNGVLRRVDIARNSQGGYLFSEEQATLIKMEIQKHHNPHPSILYMRTDDTCYSRLTNPV